ncbi:3-keto-L-gulonate-6-phosphate decarboxylase UlaD [Mesomycoplasma hyorhinis]|uniref:3-dehydro-L-gulonate-6-phosphate decarboxylase n=4 Tax=Mesomycoplasma hyorhinis TaxID=2100 RepID=A0AAJ5NPE0_MESHY|nr:3-keto-L-gulonate-6-phosphate decarboxylase UlaD [Mesomycoplasma hyorhinis]ADM21913.1 hexulose 6 phosphate synthase [Mesomycoplasma hyorhinis HUB-1]AEC46258.1 3-keto-L-gulonate-6-phosphate decarboxylase [Mesomycoplasma hyorhinis MCLD]AFX74431.1 3-keto-L-gulonate 6-phosphate decarboxylase [Mesomycoplasma hyorhinis SK76]AHA41243.1 putative 3-keto-L-gulonate-6-phosphate decarboxylase [Mesomycoplasma hyorhinis DBS 1050]AOD25480.1 3-keto-L-gulonate 6-phosphate decarboxylase [Mesomycoplasma hyorh
MPLPLLQIALDNLTIEDAINSAKKAQKYIDIIEVGTILLASEGKKAIVELKKAFPDKIIIADGKVADAGKVFSKMFFESGADFVTAICAAEVPTMNDILNYAKDLNNANNFNIQKDLQIEMTYNFTWEQVEKWRQAGVKQLVWHRSRDLQASGKSWSDQDIEIVKKLASMGFKMTVTGGVEVKDIHLFKDIPIYIFIAGRSIRDAENPELAAKEFKDEFKKYWQ